jgi:hypothetical protein
MITASLGDDSRYACGRPPTSWREGHGRDDSQGTKEFARAIVQFTKRSAPSSVILGPGAVRSFPPMSGPFSPGDFDRYPEKLERLRELAHRSKRVLHGALRLGNRGQGCVRRVNLVHITRATMTRCGHTIAPRRIRAGLSHTVCPRGFQPAGFVIPAPERRLVHAHCVGQISHQSQHRPV